MRWRAISGRPCAAAEGQRQADEARRLRLHQRGAGCTYQLSNDYAMAEFQKRCDSTQSFESVKHVAIFGDGDGFFISRDNGRSYWTGLPAGLSGRLAYADRNTQVGWCKFKPVFRAPGFRRETLPRVYKCTRLSPWPPSCAWLQHLKLKCDQQL